MSYKISLLQNAAFRLCKYGPSITVSVRHVLKIQAFAARYFWEIG